MTERHEGGLSTADLATAGQQRNAQPAPAAEDGPAAGDWEAAPPRPAEQPAGAAQPDGGRPGAAPLFAPEEAEPFRQRWSTVQAGFVDEPRRAVEDADGLVAGVIKRLAEVFAEERSRLEEQWSRGGDVSTEDLRVALQRYRSFFDRLLSV